MANILILGGGFGGVVTAERLAKSLGHEHQITLISRTNRFIFYPGLVRLAFGKCETDDISYDLREAMLDRRIRFIEAEVERVNPYSRKAILAGGEVKGEIPYDYLVLALGRRLAVERVEGFRQHAHHLLTVDAALRFGQAVNEFKGGRVVLGFCSGARLAVPVYETAFALSRLLEERGLRERASITVISPERPTDPLGAAEVENALHSAMDAHQIKFIPHFPVTRITQDQVLTTDGLNLNYDLLMLIPPFQGASAAAEMGLDWTDKDGYVRVDKTMRVPDVEGVYAVGDCVNFGGPKMGHMAVHQAEVAARNITAEIEGREPKTLYNHEITLVIDEGGQESIYLKKELGSDEQGSVKQGRFWGWAKRVHERYWQAQHD